MTQEKRDILADAIHRRQRDASTRAELRGLLRRLVLIGITAYLVFTRVFLITQVSGMDMFPALKDGDLAIAFRLQPEYVKNDVVAYQTADGSRFGRVIACGGDVVTISESGVLQVNGTIQAGEILYPTYALEGLTYPYRVPEKSLFVLGDYRTQAADSRLFGAIPLSMVDGKVITLLRRRGL